MPEAPITAVLIHGAWAGGWVWDALTPCIEERGFNVLAPDLAGCGGRLGNPADASLDQCVTDLIRQLKDVDGPLLLVGHSGGGAVATQLAEAICEQVVAPQTVADALNAFVAGRTLTSPSH